MNGWSPQYNKKMGRNVGLIQGVPTSFRYEALKVKISKPCKIRICILLSIKFVKLKGDSECKQTFTNNFEFFVKKIHQVEGKFRMQTNFHE